MKIYGNKTRRKFTLEKLGVDGRIILNGSEKFRWKCVDWTHVAEDREGFLSTQ
jgi:hypothetical protein